MAPWLLRPALTLEHFSTSELAACRPVTLRARDEQELLALASRHDSFWRTARARGDLTAEALADLQAKPGHVQTLVDYAIVQLVRVSLRADYGTAGMRKGAFNEAKLYSEREYAAALLGGLRVARKCKWAPHTLPAAPLREPPPDPFPYKRREEPLARVRRVSSASSGSSIFSLSSITETTESPDAEHAPKRQLQERQAMPEQVFLDD